MTESTVEVSNDLLEEIAMAAKTPGSFKKHESGILTKVSGLLRSEGGIEFLYNNIETIVQSGIFAGTSWENVDHLVPTLVKGTLCGGYPMVVYESLNEIRMLKLALGEWTIPEISQENARQFLQEAIIASFDLALHDGGEETRYNLTPNGLKRLKLLFAFILKRMPVEDFKDKLATEILEVSAQRPISTNRIKELLHLVKDNYDLSNEKQSDAILVSYIDAAFYPTVLSKNCDTTEDYHVALLGLSGAQLKSESQEIASKMLETGLVSVHHAVLVRMLVDKAPKFIPVALGLTSHGVADFERHESLVLDLIKNNVVTGNEEVVYGLSGLLNRNLLSRRAVLHSLQKLIHIQISPSVHYRLTKGQNTKNNPGAKQLLIGGVIRMLGHPLGVGQGMNPTCQSARGLSMWSRHSPGKLLEMLVSAAVADEVKVRYQGELISCSIINNNQTLDLDLDPVSVVLVPLLDNIYKQMIKKAQLKFPFEDPHVSVNPAFYGLWVPTGFATCYNGLLNAVQGYDDFVKLFYAVFHPDYNEGFRLVYPIPIGIFITTSRAELLGFHAISLLRIDHDSHGVVRAYFFNPNNDGRQDWGQEIKPTVYGNGERHGESSLPFHEFLSRIYAFHYISIEGKSVEDKSIPQEKIEVVKDLAKNSWGQKYFWD